MVTVILPVRNEEKTIRRCLQAVLAQDYPGDRLEVIVADGDSDDRTRNLVEEIARRDPRVRLIENPARIMAAGFNRGLARSRGQVVIVLGGHCELASDYVRRCVEDLNQVQADCVGGPIRTVGETRVASGIALAQSSRFGVGDAAFRYSHTAQFVDTLAFGAYRRDVFERIGPFDEELVRNQDDEFNFRLTRAGGRIWLDPAIQSTYYSRSTLRALWRQYWQYGFWKVKVIRKHGRPAAWRHLVPITWVLSLCVAALASLITLSAVPLLAVALPYLVALFGISLWYAFGRGWRYFPVLPLAFATMHLAYGGGSLLGWFHFAGTGNRPLRAIGPCREEGGQHE
jgi:glycosyltransferase involved in cell wall biosynthesis